MRRSLLVAGPIAVLALIASGCGSTSGSSSASSPSASSPSAASSTGSSLKSPGTHTIGVIPSTATSENLGVWIAQLKAAAEPLGWTIVVCDGAGVVTKMEACMSSLVTQKVSAIVTMALGGPEIPNGFKQAAAANIPVMAEGTSVSPGYEKNYTGGIYADDIVKSGAATADYIFANLASTPVIGLEITQNYGGQGYIIGLKAQLEAKGSKFKDLRDVNLADIVNSMTKTSEAIFQANPGKATMIDFSDFGYSLWGPVLTRLNRASDVTTITRFDNPSSVKAMKAGAPLLVSVDKEWQHIFDMLSAMLANFNGGTAWPANADTVNNPGATVVGIKDFPAGSDRFYPFMPALKTQIATWTQTYSLKPSTLTAP